VAGLEALFWDSVGDDMGTPVGCLLLLADEIGLVALKRPA